MANVITNLTSATSPRATATTPPNSDIVPTLSEREQLRIEFYKTYDVMTGIRIAATLGGFFSLMVLFVIYKSRCKTNKQLEDPQLKAAAAAAVAEAEAEEEALAAALEAIARLPPKPSKGPRRSLCSDVNNLPKETSENVPSEQLDYWLSSSRNRHQTKIQNFPKILNKPVSRFSSIGGGYDALLAPTYHRRLSRILSPKAEQRRLSSITCSSTASSYLERRGSAMVMPSLPPPPRYPRHKAYDEPWIYHHPIDIQVIQPTPEISPCASEVGLYAMATAVTSRRKAPLASMSSVDPPEQDSRSLDLDTAFLEKEAICPPDTEDEVSGFSTDSEAPGPSCRKFLKVPKKRRKPPERWNRCAGCVPRRRPASTCDVCMTISGSIDAPSANRLLIATTTTSSSQNSIASPRVTSSPIELRHRPPVSLLTTLSPPQIPSQETLF